MFSLFIFVTFVMLLVASSKLAPIKSAQDQRRKGTEYSLGKWLRKKQKILVNNLAKNIWQIQSITELVFYNVGFFGEAAACSNSNFESTN